MSHRVTFIQPLSNSAFPRFVIWSDRDEFWDGESWTPEQAEAQLYADSDHVSTDCANLQRAEATNKPHLLMASLSIRIEAFGDVPIDPEVIKTWLREKMKLSLSFDNGSGPTQDSIVLATVVYGDWTDTTPRPSNRKKGKP